MTTKPVVVYGTSGYTGRLVAEYLREYNVPFIAAGRDKARIAEAMDKVPGGPASRPAARPSATVSCSARCAASAWSWSRT